MPQSSVLEHVGVGLTTTQSPFIEQVRRGGQLYIHQPYELYSDENHEAWKRLFAAQLPLWKKYANEHFLRGVENLCLPPDRVPRLSDVNQFLSHSHPPSAHHAGRLPRFHC